MLLELNLHMQSNNSIQLLSSILCQKSIIDLDTNNLTLVDLIEEIHLSVPKIPKTNSTASFPLPGFRFEHISFLFRDKAANDTKIAIETDLIDPSGKILNTYKENFVFPAGPKRMRFRNRITGLSLTTAGDYYFKTRMTVAGQGEILTNEVPLHVIIQEILSPPAATVVRKK